MNQIGVGLVIGGVLGFGIGLTLAPDIALPGMSAEHQDLLCLEERTELMEEVRTALKQMEAAQCAAPAEAAIAVLPGAANKPSSDAGLIRFDAAKAQVAALPLPALRRPDAGMPAAMPLVQIKPVVENPKVKPKTQLKPESTGGWMVQLVATADPSEAGKVERLARGLGLNTRINLEILPDQSRSLYKVRIGPYSDKAGGVEALRRVKRELKITGWLHRDN
ncbi:MAG: SPOR domain-containing protein [Myxococcota bacterium]|nr:SPOR domain-containing protein [Myxococcota bacterium]